MRLTPRPRIWLGLLVFLGVQVQSLTGAADSIPSATDTPPLFGGYTPETFSALAAAQAQIDPGNLREELLSAAIFHESNRRRAQLHLPALRADEKVRAAALQHAVWMARSGKLSHEGPGEPKETSPYDRLVQQGLQPRFTAENIAFNFLLQYESGRPFYTRQENGVALHSYRPDGPPLPLHTYLSFAEAILTQWMNSPHHRENMVSAEPEFLGVGCGLTRDEKGFDVLYATQDFYAPFPARIRAP